MAKINHCGKSFAAENRYVAVNYPGNGDITYFDQARCFICGNSVHSYQIQYMRARGLTDVEQSDKHNRHKFDILIQEGIAFTVPAYTDELPRNTRAQVLACEWTLKTTNPADSNIYYLNENEAAPWVSNASLLHIERKRANWLKDLRQNGQHSYPA